MNFEDLVLPENPYRGYFVNNGCKTDSIDSLDLISHIVDNLYVGGCINDVDLGDFFSHIFSLYMWEQYKVGPNTKVIEVKMYDSASNPVDVETVNDMAEQVVAALAEGGNVLVHCQAGINRSNLVAATALIKMGYAPADAVALLRERRDPAVLANKTFERHILNG